MVQYASKYPHHGLVNSSYKGGTSQFSKKMKIKDPSVFSIKKAPGLWPEAKGDIICTELEFTRIIRPNGLFN
jgi:hypothetical protein